MARAYTAWVLQQGKDDDPLYVSASAAGRYSELPASIHTITK